MISGNFHSRIVHRRRDRSGFTLIELLIAITIMLILFSMTAGIVSLAINTDRIPSSARTVQAALLGARDRAVRAGRADLNQQPRRGIRFVSSPTLLNTVSSLIYIGSQDDWVGNGPSANPASSITVTHDTTGISFNPLLPTNLPDLTGSRIKILEPGGSWYRVQDSTATSLTRKHVGNPMDPIKDYGYRIELPPAILPNEQPLPLDSNVVIDLNRSEVPPAWDQEILFSPNGNVAGPLAAQGTLYLYLCSVDDVLNGYGPTDAKSGEKLAIKINLQTGQVQSFPVDPTDNVNNGTLMAPPDGIADDPFKFAKQ